MSSAPRDPHAEEGAGQERWLISYADFITLMFAFFAVLYATSEKDVQKSKEFQESIKKYLIKAGGVGGAGPAQINQATKANSPIESPIPTYKDGKPETLEVLDQTETFVESQFTPEERKKFIQDISADDWGVRIVMPAAVLYGNGNEKFREDAIPFLTKLSDLIAKSKRKVMIEGHVAEGQVGAYRSTWDFASARGVNLLRFVQAKQKLSGNQMVAVSLGDSRPDFKGEQAALNARIVVVLLNQDMEF